MEMLEYFCDTDFQKEQNSKWSYLLDYVISTSDVVEFNILKKSYNSAPEIRAILCDMLSVGKREDKLYSSGKCISFKLTDKVIQFIKSKEYLDWVNYYFEDISFLKNGREILFTITHENYVAMLLSKDEKEHLNKKLGYNFITRWN